MPRPRAAHRSAFQNWFALVGPKGIPQDRRAKLFEAASRTMARPEVQSAMRDRGITPVWDKPGEFDAYVKGFVERGNAVLKDLGLTKEELAALPPWDANQWRNQAQ